MTVVESSIGSSTEVSSLTVDVGGVTTETRGVDEHATFGEVLSSIIESTRIPSIVIVSVA